MSKIFLVDIEGVATRYTGEWKDHLPPLLRGHGFEVIVVDGPTDIPRDTTPGAFLNFGGTNIYKAVQVEKFSRMFCNGEIKDGDYFLFTDAWHPGIINLKYMSALLNIKISIGALWHAGCYDPYDFLGRIDGDAHWARHTEEALYAAIDHNYFATAFHIDLFAAAYARPYDATDRVAAMDTWISNQKRIGKIVQTGWPMEYMRKTLRPYANLEKRDLILFPHRLAPEKQVEIFRDLAEELPEYEFVVCQDRELSKHAYHTLLGQSKIVFSASLQETLGIGCFEGALLGALPFVPNRLSYDEMYFDQYKYPGAHTLDWRSYSRNKSHLCRGITDFIEQYDQRVLKLHEQVTHIETTFFNCIKLIDTIKGTK